MVMNEEIGGWSIAKYLDVPQEVNIGTTTLTDKLKLRSRLQELNLDF